MAIFVISSIQLLKTFIAIGTLGADASSFTETGVMWPAIIYLVFILAVLAIA